MPTLRTLIEEVKAETPKGFPGTERQTIGDEEIYHKVLKALGREEAAFGTPLCEREDLELKDSSPKVERGNIEAVKALIKKVLPL